MSILLLLFAGFVFVSSASFAQSAKTSPFFNVVDYGAVGDGKTTRGILLVGNQLSSAKNSFVLKNGAQKKTVVEK